MRIVVSNPDTLGDFVLRQPMYRALLDAGHELLLVVRRSVGPLAPYVAPGAKTVVLPYEVYAHDVDRRWGEFADTFADTRDFAPDALLVAPYRWTLFEERLAAELPPAVKRIGMSGHLYPGDPHAGPSPQSTLRLDVTADVREDTPEVEKNAALAAAVLGGAPVPAGVDPKLAATEAGLEPARRTLGRLGLEPGGYFVACVGGTAHVAIKTWPAAHWGPVLAEWARRTGRRFLFVGLPQEAPATREVLEAMAAAGGDDVVARHAEVWLEPGGTLDELLALTQLSAGYVGHDTGPMHLAAATGRPTLAVFGGGTWPRFLPAVDPSVALTVGVPCVGCGWLCGFFDSHCIKAVPPDAVLEAAMDLEAGRVARREGRVIEPSKELRDRMLRESAELVRQQVRERAALGQRLQEAYRRQEADVAALREARESETGELAARAEAREAEAARLRAEAQAARDEAAAARQDALRRAAEAEALRRQLESEAAEARKLSATLEAQTVEVGRLRDEIRGMVRDMDRSNGDGRGQGGRRRDGNGVHQPAAGDAPAGVETVAPDRGGDGGAARDTVQNDELALLRAAIERMEGRLRALEPQPFPYGQARKPLRQVAVELLIGGKTYGRRAGPVLPKVTIVTPLLNEAGSPAAEARLRTTIEAVLAQHYHALEYVVVDGGSTDATADVLRDYEDRIDRVLREKTVDPLHAVALGFDAATGDVLHFLYAGDVLEPGAVQRVAEYFARHPRAQAAYAEDAYHADGGWKFPAPPQPSPDVYHLLHRDAPFENGVFARTWAVRILGGMKPQYGRAADVDLWLRLSRRFGLRRIRGHLRSIPYDRGPSAHGARRLEDLRRVRCDFEAGFGPAGRFRCAAIRVKNALAEALRGSRNWGRFFFPPFHDGQAIPDLPPGEPPAFAAGQPVCPLTDRPPDRVLFSTPDTTGGDRAVHHVYYDSPTGTAIAYPPLPLEKLSALYARRHAEPQGQVVPPDKEYESLYAGYTGGRLGLGIGKLLAQMPSPWWWYDTPQFGDATADEVVRLLRGAIDFNDATVRVLNAGCFEGAVLDRLKRQTRWQTFGAETNPAAAAVARGKGHVVWEAAPQDLPLALPPEETFDVVLLTNTAEHLSNPLLVLRRLRQVLSPGGFVVLDQPNLDSAHAELFGPTWSHWQVPYHRTLMGRRGVRRMASLADMKVVRLHTRSDPYPLCVSVQLNELGLGAVVPDTARFPNAIASRGVRLAGWSRLLWDWRGRGDYMYVLMKAL